MKKSASYKLSSSSFKYFEVCKAPKKKTIMRPPSEFGTDTSRQSEEAETVSPAMVICTKLAGRAIIRVVGRCDEAQESNNLDLSECQLVQVPDAVYHLMRHTELKGCNLSSNAIKKIPPKFAMNFSLIMELNLSHNQISKLPEELADLMNLEKLNISHNTFIAMPDVVYKVPKLTYLDASRNCIIDMDVDQLKRCSSINTVDLTENPLTPSIRSGLSGITNFTVTFSNDDLDDL